MKNLIYSALLIFISACSVEPGKKVPEEFMAGQAQFNKVCANCHGPDAMGGNRAPSMIQERFTISKYSNENISQIITNGSNSGAMPSLKNRVSEKEIEEIIKYIRYLQKESGLT